MRQNGKANAIEKTLEILLAFTPHNQEMGTSEISQKLAFHKATTSRILLTLTEYGFLRQNPHTKKFALGQAVHELGLALTDSLSNNFVQIAKPYVNALRDTLDETITLELWSGNSTVMAYIAENTRPVRVAGRVGDRLPFHAAAGAKSILAFAEPTLLESLLEQELERFTPTTVTDPYVFKEQLAEFRERGFAIDYEEIDVGICAVGAPIFNHQNRPIAAAVVVTPTQRLFDSPDSKTIMALKQTTEAISKNFFHKNGNQAG